MKISPSSLFILITKSVFKLEGIKIEVSGTQRIGDVLSHVVLNRNKDTLYRVWQKNSTTSFTVTTSFHVQVRFYLIDSLLVADME